MTSANEVLLGRKETEKLDTTERSSMKQAMERAGLKHVETRKRKIGDPIRYDDKPVELELSEQKTLNRVGGKRPDRPELLQTSLAYHVGDVAKQRDLFIEFFGQWSTSELQLFKDVVINEKEAPDEPELKDHPFVARALSFRSIFKSYPVATAAFTFVVERRERGNSSHIDPVAAFAFLAEEIGQRKK